MMTTTMRSTISSVEFDLQILIGFEVKEAESWDVNQIGMKNSPKIPNSVAIIEGAARQMLTRNTWIINRQSSSRLSNHPKALVG